MAVRKMNPHLRPDDIVVIRRIAKPKKLSIGEAKKKNVQHEKKQATALEGDSNRPGLFYLHRVDWVHFETVKDSKGTLKSGFPDYFIVGKGWTAYLEIKARNPENNRAGKLSTFQEDFHSLLRAAGHDVMTATLPEDLQKVNLWLREKTGIVCSIDGLVPS